MLSRIADSLFWLNRYMERADSLTRLTAIHYILSMDNGVNALTNWRPVLETATYLNSFDIGWIENNTTAALQKLLLDTSNHNSLKVLIHRARENARGIQDHITKEVWEEVNQLYHYINEPSLTEKLNGNLTIEVLDTCASHLVMFTGITEITMPRDSGWNFMNLGKYIERCFHTVGLLQKQLQLIDYNIEEPKDLIQWRYLLLALSGYEMHLKTYNNNNYTYNLLHQIIFNENFTRSVLYTLSRLHIYLNKTMPAGSPSEDKVVLNLFGRLYSTVRYAEPDSLNKNNIKTFLSDINSNLQHFSIQLAQHFFSYA